ncbi:MAG: alpha-ketoacid dehydrogenase subunit beta [Microbacterium sp.]|nr:alpha-ketoacid dehydrogenase subunit beta [Microbacterium sp.]
METINYRQAIARSLAEAMRRDPDVLFFGEDVAVAGGAFKATPGLLEEFGPRRVRDTPISEQAIVGAALGAAVTGLRPVAEVMFADFAAVCFDQIVNQVAKYRYMSGGQLSVPLVIRMSNGAGAGFGAQHSQPAENWFLNVPGLKIVTPGTVEDLFGLMLAAVEDDDPVLFFEHKNLFAVKGQVPAIGGAPIPLGRASVVRRGGDVTIVANQQMRHVSLAAADELAREGIQATVIDPRTLVPFDDATVLDSLRETSRLVVVQEAPPDGSWGASLISRVVSKNLELIDAPPALVAAEEIPVPYAAAMEERWLPRASDVVSAVQRAVAY